MRVGAVIVAAGMSRRMHQFKQMIQLKDLTFAERVVLNFKRAGVRDIVMVTGYQAETLEKSLQHLGIVFLRNEAYETTEMFDSAKLGLSYLADRVDRVFFCPADVPFFLVETLQLELTRQEQVVYPVCHNRLGHPVLFDTALIPEILAYSGPRGLKGALDSVGAHWTGYLPVADEGAIMDADTPRELEYLIDLQNARLMRPEVKVTLAGRSAFFGPDTAVLLRQIDSLGNVSEACARTRISYSRGWKMIREAERELGYKIVERTAGGRNGGMSSVTARGRRLLELYELLERRTNEAATREICGIFSTGDLFSRDAGEETGKRRPKESASRDGKKNQRPKESTPQDEKKKQCPKKPAAQDGKEGGGTE